MTVLVSARGGLHRGDEPRTACAQDDAHDTHDHEPLPRSDAAARLFVDEQRIRAAL